MANNKSWEYYQQPDTGTQYPLVWIAGCATPALLMEIQLTANQLYLIPFNQVRGVTPNCVTLDKLGIEVTFMDTNGKVHLGIYANNADDDNYPTTKVVDGGELLLNAVGLVETAGLATTLNADTR